jgi:hypothetical protein
LPHLPAGISPTYDGESLETVITMNRKLQHTLLRGLAAGSCASVLSAAALAFAGRREAGSAAAPINAVSHWYWDREALHRQRVDMKHTVVGYATHHIAATFWAAGLAAYLHARERPATPRQLAGACAATSAIACFVDFKLTPERLTPGYEHRVSRKSLALTYLLFAVGLAVGCAAADSRAACREA